MDASGMMSTPEGLREPASWANVQDPVRQMLSALTKAVRTQAAGIRDLDRAVERLPSKTNVEHTVANAIAGCATKNDLASVRSDVDLKASASDVKNVEDTLGKITSQLERINTLLHSQNNAITSMNARINQLSGEVVALQSPSYDKVFKYVDKQMSSLITDLERRLAGKLDVAQADLVSAPRVDELVRSVLDQMATVKADVGDKATRGDFAMLLKSKADSTDIRRLVSDIDSRPTVSQVAQTVNAQVTPLVTAITALEKEINMQQIDNNNLRIQIHKYEQEKYSLETTLRALTPEMVYDLIEEKLREKAFGDISSMALEAALADAREAILAQVQSRSDALKAELLMNHKDGVGALKRQVDSRLQDFANSIRETREVVSRNKASTKELSANVAKALSNKVDRADLKRVLKEQVETGALVLDGVAGRSGRGAVGDADIATLRGELDALRQHMGAMEHTMAQVRSQVGAVQTAVSIAVRNKDSIRTGVKGSGAGSVARGDSSVISAAMSQSEASVRAAVSAGWDSVTLPPPPPGSFNDDGSPVGDALTNVDLRIALGEMSFALRKELSEKVSKSELYQALKAEFDVLDRKLASCQSDMSQRATLDDVTRLESETSSLKARLGGGVIAGRWLWTSGRVLKDGWVPWDVESGAHSSATRPPDSIQWRAGGPNVRTKQPGLYRISVAVFTSLPSILQVCLNGEPIFAQQPSDASSVSGAAASKAALQSASLFSKEDKYLLRRFRHSSGEVTALSIAESVCLPADATLAVRFLCDAPVANAQGFLIVEKM